MDDKTGDQRDNHSGRKQRATLTVMVGLPACGFMPRPNRARQKHTVSADIVVEV